MDLKTFLKTKPGQITFLVFSLLLGVWSIHGFVDLTRQTHSRGVAKQFSAAVKELQNSRPGIQRAEVFVKKLKAIDPGYAPADVKQALNDYIYAAEQSLPLVKAGQYTNQYDAAMADAKQRLITALKRSEDAL